jgi:hypothetical protein
MGRTKTRRGNVARGAALAGVAAMSLALSGCISDDYKARRDTVTLGAGDAVAVNQVTQTIDPWPPHAKNSQIDVDGRRLGIAVQRYQQNKSIQPRGLNTTTVTEQAGPGAQASTAIQK